MPIAKLTLHNFRSHSDLTIETDNSNMMIVGQNGVGKTNLLEAISMLAPGRGMHYATIKDIQNYNAPALDWFVRAEFDDCASVSASVQDKKVAIKMNNILLPRKMDILDNLRILWVYPAMDTVVDSAAAIKRKFIDRVVYNFIPKHAALLQEYEACQKSRYALLIKNNLDDIWLDKLEQNMIERSISICNNRKKILGRITSRLQELVTYNFANATINMSCQISDALEKGLTQEQLQSVLRYNRQKDLLSKRTNFGIHRSQFQVINIDKSITSKQCSTGEKKAMLVSIVLAQLVEMQQCFDGEVIVLLDDIFAHLDPIKCEKLLNKLDDLKVQYWITNTSEVESNCKSYYFHQVT